jgi:hypothetical protein
MPHLPEVMQVVDNVFLHEDHDTKARFDVVSAAADLITP